MAKMIIRVRCKDGTFRVSLEPNEQFSNFLSQLKDKLGDVDNLTLSNSPGDKGSSVDQFIDKSIQELGFKNGDMVFAHYLAKAQSQQASKSIAETPEPVELPVDKLLDVQDGLIKRPKSNLCRHGDKGMCEYCAPLPPWDKEYAQQNGIKHLSFFSYVKQLNEEKNNTNNVTSYMAPLDVPNYQINKNCTAGHLPYPRGICSKCQTPVITLQQQKFRMVDHVEFADSSILNKFIDAWRISGTQRLGYLYGSYEPFDRVPLGIQAKVEFIYEPPQTGEMDGLTLLEWPNEPQIDELARGLGLYKVGVIFTDLTDSGLNNGTVLCKRHKDSYFLSCLEVMMAARNQIKYPNKTKYSSGGEFSSKFVTCVISGGLNSDIEPRSYQVSINAEALVKADIITSSTQPSMMYINETTDQRYVPDVLYSKINEYGLQVKSNAKPALPIDYLLVSLSDSFPMNPNPMFNSPTPFTIENREFIGESQNLGALYHHLSTDDGNGAILFDFHLLAYLLHINVLQPPEQKLLVKFIKSKAADDYIQLVESSGWMSLITVLENSS